ACPCASFRAVIARGRSPSPYGWSQRDSSPSPCFSSWELNGAGLLLQVKPTDHVMPTVQTSPGHRGCIGRDDQGERAGLHYQVRGGDVAAAIAKLADDHIGYGGAHPPPAF